MPRGKRPGALERTRRKVLSVIESGSIQIPVEKLLAGVRDRVCSPSNVHEEAIILQLTTSRLNVVRMVFQRLSDFRKAVSDCGRRVIPKLREKFENPLVRLVEPFSVLSHTTPDLRELQNPAVKQFLTSPYVDKEIRDRFKSRLSKDLSYLRKTIDTGTKAGHANNEHTDTLRQLLSAVVVSELQADDGASACGGSVNRVTKPR